MCYRNLPIEFDEKGKPYLKSDTGDPWDPPEIGSGIGNGPAVAQPAGVTDFTIDPVTRVAGALGFHTRCDLDNRRVVEAHSYATLFRGYEIILQGRDPRDAIDISSRACGVCGAVHSTCSSLALEMAFPVVPPPLGVVARNLGETAEFLYDHPLHLFLLAGPDYSEQAFAATNPEILAKARDTRARGQAVHRFLTIGEILTALNPLTGSLYREAFEITRLAREMCCLMYGKYPHPSTLLPGGCMTTLSFTSFNDYYRRLVTLFDYAKRAVAIWDDVFDFLLQVEPRYAEVGRRPNSQVGPGIFDDPEAYDAKYENASAWGERRWATPGAIVNGELRTTKLGEINLGVEEFVPHSFYEDWQRDKVPFPTDPTGAPLSPYHPWNKRTIPKPTARTWKEKYSWATSPRWDRNVMEAGCYSRIWFTAIAQKMPSNPYIEATGTSLKMRVPAHLLPETELEWKVPAVLNTIERNRARAYCIPWMALIALNNLNKGFELLKKGETKVHTPYQIPKDHRIGVGFWEAGRGYLTHHVELDGGKIKNYQILTPSTWNASPQDPWGKPGAYEEAVLNTPILETFASAADFKGIDIQRVIRSFDPCMPCTTHIYAGGREIVRDVNSCACGSEYEN